MKKIASLMAGVAVLALTVTAAAAQTAPGVVTTVRTGQWTTGINAGHTTVNDTGSLDAIQPVANGRPAGYRPDIVSAWISTTTSTGNEGAAALSDSATFTLAGNVTKDCAFYTGDRSNLTFDFGQIGIRASDDAGLDAAFKMVAPATMNFDTSVAGCNTPNTVTIAKNDIRGLVNNNGGAYDTAVFQANLPYSVAATYTAAVGTAAGSQQTLTVGTGANAGQATQGAWKSNMDLLVTVPTADRALLAGDYAGNFTVTIAAN